MDSFGEEYGEDDIGAWVDTEYVAEYGRDTDAAGTAEHWEEAHDEEVKEDEAGKRELEVEEEDEKEDDDMEGAGDDEDKIEDEEEEERPSRNRLLASWAASEEDEVEVEVVVTVEVTNEEELAPTLEDRLNFLRFSGVAGFFWFWHCEKGEAVKNADFWGFISCLLFWKN